MNKSAEVKLTKQLAEIERCIANLTEGGTPLGDSALSLLVSRREQRTDLRIRLGLEEPPSSESEVNPFAIDMSDPVDLLRR